MLRIEDETPCNRHSPVEKVVTAPVPIGTKSNPYVYTRTTALAVDNVSRVLKYNQLMLRYCITGVVATVWFDKEPS